MRRGLSVESCERLLAHLQSRLDARLEFAAPPTRIAGSRFSAVYSLRVSDGAGRAGWPLILRCYDPAVGVEQVRLEGLIQESMAAQGIPAPRPVVACEDRSVIGRMFLLMERVPGRPVVETRWSRFPAQFRAAVRTWPSLFHEVLGALQAADGDQVLGAAPAAGLRPDQLSCDRHVALVTARLARYERDGFADVLAWLAAALPPPKSSSVIVHGDLWLGNVLTDHGRLSGLIDWNRAGLGHPALDVGFATAGLALMPAPYAAPPPFKKVVNRAGNLLALRIEDATGLDPSDVWAFQALRCLLELADIASEPPPSRAPWARASHVLIAHLRELTGLPVRIPADLHAGRSPG